MNGNLFASLVSLSNKVVDDHHEVPEQILAFSRARWLEGERRKRGRNMATEEGGGGRRRKNEGGRHGRD
jgi:hypothetical protein